VPISHNRAALPDGAVLCSFYQLYNIALERGLSYSHVTGTPKPCVPLMSSDRIIVDAIKVAQDLLLQNLPPAHNFTDAATVMRFRELVRSQAIRSALERSSDTLLTFALRAVERVVSDQSQTNRETINRLWDILDNPHLNKALGLPQNSRMTFRRSRF
jgi:hypothetical protein